MSYINTSNSNLSKLSKWSEERNLYDFDNGITPISQTFKVLEELGELYAGLLRNNDDQIKDGIGDTQIASYNLSKIFELFKFEQNDNITPIEHKMLLALHNIGEMSTSILLKREDMFSNALTRLLTLVDDISKSKGYQQYECLDAAFNVIKDRQGVMLNRNFVKAEDSTAFDCNNNNIDNTLSVENKMFANAFMNALYLVDSLESAEILSHKLYNANSKHSASDVRKYVCEVIQKYFANTLNTSTFGISKMQSNISMFLSVIFDNEAEKQFIEQRIFPKLELNSQDKQTTKGYKTIL
jgi:hypothetical protein